MELDEDRLELGLESPRPSRLYRAREERVVAGVCGGLAHWLGLSPSFVRIVYVALSIFSATFPGLLVYVVLWVAIPEEPRPVWRARSSRYRLYEPYESEL